MKKSLLFVVCITAAGVAYSQQIKTAKKPGGNSKISAVTKTKEKYIAPVIREIEGDNSLLFQVSGRGLTKPSYLFGTMHMLCADDARLSDGLKAAIKESGQVYFEVDMDDLQQMIGALQFMRMKGDRKISDLITPAEYERVKKYFDSAKVLMPFAMMNRFKPFFVSAMIGENLLECDKKASMEQEIMTETKKSEKNILGLETLEFQASIFDSIPYEKQAKEMLDYVDSIDQYKKMMQETVRMYKKQDINGLDSLMKETDPGMSEYMDLMLFDRNRRWVGQIAEQVFEMPTLFAVGAGHLGGNKGLIALLRKEGFTVRALKN